MSISMYGASVPVFDAMLASLSHVLAKGEESATERKIDPAVLVNGRLAPDMYPLSRQVQVATDHAKGAPSRLAGRDAPRFEDTESSFPELQARIAKTRDYLKTFTPADIDGSDDREIVLKLGPREMRLPGSQYLLGFAMPNFYFHVTTAYTILRHNGVAIGKRDFLWRP